MFHHIQRIIPQHFLTRLAGVLANTPCVFVKNALIRLFIRVFKVDLSQAHIQDPTQFKTFNAFFTRALKPELRPIAPGTQRLVSPTDSTISQLGTIQADKILQAKNHNYTVSDLIGHTVGAKAFLQGQFITLYLAPKDYHRVHMPCAGILSTITYIPGQLFSVNQKTTMHIPNLFARNERMICLFETPHGTMAVVFVGAMIVGHIETNWLNSADFKHTRTAHTQDFREQKLSVAKGEEIGHFKLGSTVILLFERDRIRFKPNLAETQTLRMGEAMGEICEA